MKMKLIVGLFLFVCCMRLGAAGEVAYFNQAILLNNEVLATSLLGIILDNKDIKEDKKTQYKEAFGKKFNHAYKPAAGSVKLPGKPEDATETKFEGLFGTTDEAYGTQVFKNIGKNKAKAAAQKVVEAAEKVQKA